VSVSFSVCLKSECFVCLGVWVSVCALKGKWLVLSAQSLVEVWSIADPRHALTLKSKDQRMGQDLGYCLG